MTTPDRPEPAAEPEEPLLRELRESGNVLESSAPPFDPDAAASWLREAGEDEGMLLRDCALEDDLISAGHDLEQSSPPFDVEARADTIMSTARALGLLDVQAGHVHRFGGEQALEGAIGAYRGSWAADAAGSRTRSGVLETGVARKRLEAMRDDLDRSILVLQAEHPRARGGGMEAGDAGANLTEADRNEAAIESAWVQRNEVTAALARVEDGSYGKCTDCGQPVPDGRLEARPTTTRCVACQSKRDRRRR